MLDYPKVSVVTITYGHENYISQTLDGVIMQDYPGKIEFIIANDHSPDATDKVVEDYFSNRRIPDNFIIKYNRHKSNKGMMPNFIWAMEEASGKYIAICEGDDYWTDPLKLQKQVDFLEENEECGLVHTNYNEYYEIGKKIVKHQPTKFTRSDENEYYFKSGDLRTCTVLFRSSYIKKLSELYKEDFVKNAVIGDRPLFLLIAASSKIHFIPEITSVYRITETNTASHFRDIYKYYDYLLKVTILNENLYDYLNLKVDRTGLLKNKKFYQIVLQSKTSLLSSIIQLLRSDLGLKYYQEFKTVLLNKIRKNENAH